MNLIAEGLHSISRIVRNRILSDVSNERDRQEEKWGETPRGGDILSVYPAILGEEFGEVCQAQLEGNVDNLRDELVQVAAVAVAWIEELDHVTRLAGAA